MNADYTKKVEERVQAERKPRLIHLIQLFLFAFSTTKIISAIYLGAFILLSLLRPLLAFLWGDYIGSIHPGMPLKALAGPVLLLLAYLVIHFLIDLIGRYVYQMDDIEQLNLVQANRQKETFHAMMYRKLASIPPEIYEIPKIQDRMEQVFLFISNRFGGMNTTVMLQCYCMIAKTVSLLTIALSLAIFDPWLCLLLLLAPLPTIWIKTIGNKMLFAFLKNNTGLLRRTEYYQELMISRSSKEIKVFGLHDFFYGKWKEAADLYTKNEQQLIRDQAKFKISQTLILNGVTAAGSVLAILRFASGGISLGALGAVLSMTSTLMNDMKELLTSVTTFLAKKNEAAQFFDLMELGEAREEASNDGASGCARLQKLELAHVSYRYPLTERRVLREVSLTISEGEKVAFVGRNGAGKTTAVKLMMGLLSPTEGTVRFNGRDATKLNQDACFDLFAPVMQKPARYYTFTPRENVWLGDVTRKKDSASLEEAMEFAGVSDCPTDVLLGKELGGSDLSGGQWQKLAIARAAYRKRGFYVLDEPTGNLDPIAEAEVLQKYLKLSQGQTVLFVTHRISAASLADRIVVFDEGRIVGDGTHEKLLQTCPLYEELYRVQAEWYQA